jgi:hypothetical protein
MNICKKITLLALALLSLSALADDNQSNSDGFFGRLSDVLKSTADIVNKASEDMQKGQPRPRCGWDVATLKNQEKVAEGSPPILNCNYKLNLSDYTFNLKMREYQCFSEIWYNTERDKWVRPINAQSNIYYCPNY